MSTLWEVDDARADDVTATARLSSCGRYRFTLRRDWDTRLPPLVVIMLNPSTADATRDDPTIRKCMGFARTEGRGGLVVVNLFAFRATDPTALWGALADGVDVVGAENDGAVLGALLVGDVEDVVVAWGRLPVAGAARVRAVVELLRDSGRDLRCWGRNKDGSPRHPLYLANATRLVGWEPS